MARDIPLGRVHRLRRQNGRDSGVIIRCFGAQGTLFRCTQERQQKVGSVDAGRYMVLQRGLGDYVKGCVNNQMEGGGSLQYQVGLRAPIQ